MSPRALRLLAGLAAVAVLVTVAAGCARGTPVAVGAVEIEQLGSDALPAQILGLEVALEDMSERLAAVREAPYVDSAGLFSLREGDILQATLQVTRFVEGAEVDDPSFRRLVVEQIGSTTVRSFRMGEHEIYLSTTQRQSIATWFEGRTMFILSTRDDYPTPRRLLREALELDL